MHPYATGVVEKINQAISDQMDLLREASIKLADRVEQGGLLYVLGSGHSHMIAEEIFYRAGGPIFVYPILESGFMLHDGALKSTRMERLSGYANAILDGLEIDEHDAFLVISNSGRNHLPIEAAYYMKEKNILTMSITSLAHSQSVDSRHPSGKRLFEITDISFDNYGEVGDALLTLPNTEQKYGATSSVVGIVLVQTLMSMTIEALVNRGIQPPIFQSANLDHANEQNQALIDEYKKRIPFLK